MTNATKETLGLSDIGPQSTGWKCAGCAAFETESWHEPSGDGETFDSGQYAWCKAAGRKSMGAYHYDHSVTPAWCPALAARANPLSEGEWLDIASAPKDGSMFLAFFAGGKGPSVGPMAWDIQERKPALRTFRSYAIMTESKWATHWRPMLTSPGAASPSRPLLEENEGLIASGVLARGAAAQDTAKAEGER